MERVISTITLQVALAIGSNEIFNQISKFTKEATEHEYTSFTHYNFFYSYPEWGKKWPNGETCEFHSLNTKCHLCNWRPERNYAGVGTIYLLNSGSRMTMLCPKHIKGYFEYGNSQDIQKSIPTQLALF